MPKFLGRFEPINPKLEKEKGLVCKNCNSTIFTRLERIVNEDSTEGLFAQQLNLDGSKYVRILGKRLKIDNVPGFGDSFFNEMFPFFKYENGKIVIDLKRQIKIRNYADGYQIFPVDTLETIKNSGGNNFINLKNRLSKVKSSDVSIFTGTDSPEGNDLDEIISLLKNYGIEFKEKERKFAPIDRTKNLQWKVDQLGIIDRDIGRVLAKIMFNYFTYCALQEGLINIVYNDEFKKIRNFIHGDNNIPLKTVVTSIPKIPILDHERKTGGRLLLHIVVFENKNGKIIGRLSLFGRLIYEIVIGDMLECADKENFGCGHAFDPFKKSIYNLSSTPKINPTKDDIRATFGLFRSKYL